jgi:hypothetical protein
MLTLTLGVTQKHAFSSTQNKNSITYVMYLSKIHQKEKYRLCKNMKEIKDDMPKKHEPKKREKMPCQRSMSQKKW